jgi:hypothetical protein
MADLEPPQINMSSIKVAGVGGLGMVAIVGVMAYAMPEVRGFVFLSLAGGVVAGLAFIAYRYWLRTQPPPHGPTLMVDTPAPSAPKEAPVRIDTTAKLVPVSSSR